jgi:hypothetical protein
VHAAASRKAGPAETLDSGVQVLAGAPAMEGLVAPEMPSSHDFMFSEAELSDILEFMQRSDGGEGAGHNALAPPPFFGAAPSMQFLPHAPEELPLGLSVPMPSPAPSYSSEDVYVKAEGSEARGHALGAGVNGSSSQLFPAPPPVAPPAASARTRAGHVARAGERGADTCAGGFAERAHVSGKKGARSGLARSLLTVQRRVAHRGLRMSAPRMTKIALRHLTLVSARRGKDARQPQHSGEAAAGPNKLVDR